MFQFLLWSYQIKYLMKCHYKLTGRYILKKYLNDTLCLYDFLFIRLFSQTLKSKAVSSVKSLFFTPYMVLSSEEMVYTQCFGLTLCSLYRKLMRVWKGNLLWFSWSKGLPFFMDRNFMSNIYCIIQGHTPPSYTAVYPPNKWATVFVCPLLYPETQWTCKYKNALTSADWW